MAYYECDCKTEECGCAVNRIAELEARIKDYETHGRVTKRWGELRAENEKLRDELVWVEGKLRTHHSSRGGINAIADHIKQSLGGSHD